MARAIYATGVPLSLVEHPLWDDLFRKLRPAWKLPSRKVLSTTLLEKEYGSVKDEVEGNINSSVHLNLSLDGWSNIRNEGILNFIVYTPNNPYFYSFVETKKNRHTSEYLLSEIVKIIDKLGAAKFLAVVSDNAANMVKCGRLLSEKYPHIIWIGCMAHTLHLLIGDILKCETVRRFSSDAVEIIKTIRNSQLLAADFKQIGQEKNINVSLHLPVKTRWGSYLECLNSLVATKSILQIMAINEDATKTLSKKVKQTLLDDHFWSHLENLRSLMQPIVYWITYLEGDYNSIHLVWSSFSEIGQKFDQLLSLAIESSTEAEFIKTQFEERLQNALKPIHLGACLLDPKSQGLIMSAQQQIDGCEVICQQIAGNMINVDEQNVMQELAMYRSREGIWGKEFVWRAADKICPVLWWKTFYQNTDLGKVAIKILNVPATSASVERSFSTFSHIHNKKRHKLNTTRAGKLCYIAHNWKIMHKPKPSATKPPNKTAVGNEPKSKKAKMTTGTELGPTTFTLRSDTDTTSLSSCSYSSQSENSNSEFPESEEEEQK